MEARRNNGASQKSGTDHVAPDCRGMNFYRADDAFRGLLDLYLEPALRAHLEPHLDRLGELAGGRLDELADAADKHPPVLHPRDRFGRDEDWIEYHPAYREMERIAFSEFGLHAMSHRAGVLGWPDSMPPIAKYGFQYLFVRAEFGLMCPVSVSDTSNFVILRNGSEELKRKLVPRLLSQDPAAMWKGTQFMTEKSGGSDVGALESEARQETGEWRLYGEEWFCSHTDADLALVLARPQGAATGTRGLGLFAMPRRLEDGSRNRYRIVRLKDKLGTRSMASGEIQLEGSFAWQVGELRAGFKQMLDQVNLSRLSHGVRAAAMMRRCLNEALCVARNRVAFGRTLIEMPLVRRQLLKLMVPTEQALSMYAWTADVMGRASRADEGAVHLPRIMTPLFKFRACRDNLRVATGAMEVRGGNGYRGLDKSAAGPRRANRRAVGRHQQHQCARRDRPRGPAERLMCAHFLLHARLGEASRVPQKFRTQLGEMVDRAVAFASRASGTEGERLARMAADALYNAATAVLMAWEASRLNNGRRLLLSRMVVEHRLSAQDPLAPHSEAWEERAAAMLLGESDVTLEHVAALVSQ